MDHATGTTHTPRTWWMLAGFLVIAGFFLLTEHRAHLFGLLPYLLLFACPLMHVLGHGGHGMHGGHGRHRAHPDDGSGTRGEF